MTDRLAWLVVPGAFALALGAAGCQAIIGLSDVPPVLDASADAPPEGAADAGGDGLPSCIFDDPATPFDHSVFQ